MESDFDVVIVGAGPVGLTLANILGLRGITTLVVEERDTLIDYPRGCPFRERCDYRHELSADIEPELRELSSTRMLACHLPEGVAGADRHA